ncbi:MAG: flavodoxin family protein [bacterium]|nr:flavodoxin family protein [bacterium]
MKKVLIISTSLRNNSNSEILAKSFFDGAKENNDVELISLKNKTINFCKGCLACGKLHKCVIKDDSNEIVEKMANADVIVWATPVYYYSMSGLMKTMIDRANPLYSMDYKFREVYLLATATEDESYTPEGTIKGVQCWIDCFDNVEFKKTLFVGGVTDPSDILNNPKLKEAYEMGLKV